MKKIIIGLIVLTFIISSLIFVYYNTNKDIPEEKYISKIINEDDMLQLKGECEIYIYYFNGNVTNQPDTSGKEALINIKQNKLYIIDWKNSNKNQYELQIKDISNDEINKLLKVIEEKKGTQQTGKYGTYWCVRYDGVDTLLPELPIKVY